MSTFKSFSQASIKAFTIVELMVTIAIAGIITMIALPSLNDFLVKMRVDNEIAQLNRLLLTARNTAINEGMNVTLCPLSSNTCTSNWQNELTVFTDANANGKYEKSLNERIIKVKEAIKSTDKLQYGKTNVMYDQTGVLSSTASEFKYCPKEDASLSRSIMISTSGRIYSSTDIDNDGKDEDRNGNEVSCS